MSIRFCKAAHTLEPDQRIDLLELRQRLLEFGAPNSPRAVQSLTLKVVEFENIVLGNADKPHACAHQIRQYRRPQTTCADDEHSSAFEFLLVLERETGEKELAGVTVEFWAGDCV